MSKKKIIVIVGLVLFILIASGLTWYIFNGGSGGGEGSESNSLETDKPQAASGKDVATFVASQDNLSKYNKLLITTGQSETLKSTSVGYIVLAPVNDAYKSLPNGYYDSLLTEAKKASATDITKYSIVIATNDQLTNGQKLKTTNGQEIIVEITDSKYYFISAKGDKAMAVKAAQKTSNGTLYQIDKVLLPQ
ncbi:MAG: fasciclin domain-containing protein [Candidatus Saccharibacteria bacterium]